LGFLGDEESNDIVIIENVRTFGRYIFCTLGNEDNIIIQYYLDPCRPSTDPKMRDLESLFYVKLCFFADMSRAVKPGFRSGLLVNL